MMEGKETRLSITKEQAEAFASWKKGYRERISLVKAVLRQELGVKKCENCKSYTAMNKMLAEIDSLEILEGSACIDGMDIESDFKFGFVLADYRTGVREAFWEDNTTVEATLPDIILERPMKQLGEIFFGK